MCVISTGTWGQAPWHASFCPLGYCPSGNLGLVYTESISIWFLDSRWKTEPLYAQPCFCLIHPGCTDDSLGLYKDIHFAQTLPSRQSRAGLEPVPELAWKQAAHGQVWTWKWTWTYGPLTAKAYPKSWVIWLFWAWWLLTLKPKDWPGFQ